MLFDEAEAQLPIVEAAETAFVAGYTRKKRTGGVEEILPDNVSVEAVEHRPDAAALNCPECGTLMTEIGKKVRRSLVITPAQAKIREDWFYAYVCEKCKRKGTETPVLKTEKTPSVIPGSYASPEAIAHIMVQKYVVGACGFSAMLQQGRSGMKRGQKS